MEIWKDIIGYEGYYQVSNEGRVRSLDRLIGNRRNSTLARVKGGIRKPSPSVGYLYVRLYKGDELNKGEKFYIHRLVATAFLDNPLKYRVVHHKDHNRQNNSVENLEWCSHSQNIIYSVRDGVFPSGEKNYNAILTANDVKEIRKRHSEGERIVDLYIIYGVSQQTIGAIVKRRSWKNI